MSQVCVFLAALCVVITSSLPTFQKCCEFDEWYDVNEKKCTVINNTSRTTAWIPNVFARGKLHAIEQDEFEATVANPKCTENEYVHSFTATGKENPPQFYISATGILLLKNHEDNTRRTSKEFCVDAATPATSTNQTQYLVRSCALKDPCKGLPCVRHCCPKNTIRKKNESTCMMLRKIRFEDHIVLHDVHAYSASVIERNLTNYTVLHDTDNTGLCQSNGGDKLLLDPHAKENHVFYLMRNGDMYVPFEAATHRSGQFCMDLVVEDDGSPHMIAYICADDDVLNPLGVKTTWVNESIYATALIISDVFLLATFLVYIAVPDLLHSTPGKVCIGHITNLFFAFLGFAIIKVTSRSLSSAVCSAFGMAIYFFMMGTFFWMNVMCFDTWKTFCLETWTSRRGSVSTRSRDRKKFARYAIYATVCPLIMVVIAVVMDKTPGISPFLIKPGFGDSSCWFANWRTIFTYFLGPVAVLLSVNVIFFGMTTVALLKARKQQRTLNGREKSVQFATYLKLYVIMGICWITELLSWLVRGPAYLWYVTDMFNNLQGVFIFFIYVCNERSCRRIRERWSDLTGKYPFYKRVDNHFRKFKGTMSMAKSAMSTETTNTVASTEC